MTWNFDRPILIQGIDQPKALFYLKELNLNNQNIKAGIVNNDSLKKIENIPVFDLVKEAINQYDNIETTLIFNSSYTVLDAGLEAIEAGIKQIIINTENVPPLDLLKLWQKAEDNQVKILGTSQAGILIPNKLCWGVNHAHLYSFGHVGILNYGDSFISQELALLLQKNNLGESIVVNLGNEQFINIDWDLWLKTLEKDEATHSILISLSDCSHLEYEKFISALSQISSKPIIVYLLDSNNLKNSIRNTKAKIITDRIPEHLNRVLSPLYLQEKLTEKGIKVTSQYKKIIELLNVSS